MVALDAEELWHNVVHTETEFHKARSAFMSANSSVVPILRRALGLVGERSTALRLLLSVSQDYSQEVFYALVRAASVEHKDLQLVRRVLLDMDRAWVLANIQRAVADVLGDEHVEYEEYRRLAELLYQIDSPALRQLVAKAAESSDPDIREVAEDFDVGQDL